MLSDDLKYKNIYIYGVYRPEKLLNIFFWEGTSTVVLYRVHQFFRRIHLGLVGCLFLGVNRLLNACVIGKGAQFGKGFVVMHPVGVVINGEVKGGVNIVIESGVVLGVARNGLPVKAPVLGDNIYIGTGAKVLGDIKIGNNVKIGANAVVLEDVPDGATVVGIPAKVVKKG